MAKRDAIEARIDALKALQLVWKPEDMARAGAVVSIGYHGGVEIERGLVRPEDRRPESAATGTAKAATADSKPEGERPLSAKLIEELTAHRTAALRETLAFNPDIAFVALVHSLAVQTIYGSYHAKTCLEIQVTHTDLAQSGQETIPTAPAYSRFAELHGWWLLRLPSDVSGLWAWMLKAERETLCDLLAYCAACAVNAVRGPQDSAQSARLAHADQLAQALSLDMTAWWQPTTENYLGRVSKDRIAEAVREGVSAEAAANMAGMKKAAMAQAAEERLAGKGWLPPILRTLGADAEPEALPVAAE
jgi:ParB family transcriptional regulator, chromosome partitioning protein